MFASNNLLFVVKNSIMMFIQMINSNMAKDQPI